MGFKETALFDPFFGVEKILLVKNTSKLFFSFFVSRQIQSLKIEI